MSASVSLKSSSSAGDGGGLAMTSSASSVLTASERRRQQQLELKLRKRLQDPIAQTQVRQSAQLAAERIWKAVALEHGRHAPPHHHHPSTGSSSHHSSSHHSHSNSVRLAAAVASEPPIPSLLPKVPSFDLSLASSVGENHRNGAGSRSIRRSGNALTAEDGTEGAAAAAASSNHHADDADDDELRNSEHSSERAIRRGSRRGLREINETLSDEHLEMAAAHAAAAYTEPELDAITTLTEPITEEGGGDGVVKGFGKKLVPALLRRRRRGKGGDGSSSSDHPRKKKSSKGGGAKKKKSIPGASYDDDDSASGDPWMCGVCGKVFASLTAAERHETRHIEQVVWGLGWGENQTPPVGYDLPSPAAPPTPTATDSPACADGASAPSPGIFRPAAKRTPLADATARQQQQQQQQQPQRRFRFDSSPTKSPPPQTPSPQQPQLVTSAFRSPSLPLDQAQVPVGTLIPKPRARTGSAEVRFETTAPPVISYDPLAGPSKLVTPTSQLQSTAAPDPYHQAGAAAGGDDELTLLLSGSLRDSLLLADEALLDVCCKAEPLILNLAERQAERELFLLAHDKAYYDEINARAFARKVHPTDRYRSEGVSLLDKVQNKLVDAYQICKEGDVLEGDSAGINTTDQYMRRNKKSSGTGNNNGTGETHDAATAAEDIQHDDRTLYVNVMVRNSVRVVRHELERLAGQRWEENNTSRDNLGRFERFRSFAHVNMVKLAGIALASDFTPRRIAVQLSNDLYRLLTPKLEGRGVKIETEIEYRVGPYFVLGVNILSIDWWALIQATHKDVAERKRRWQVEMKRESSSESQNNNSTGTEEATEEEKSRLQQWRDFFIGVYEMPGNDILAHLFYWMYYVHCAVYLPLCYLAYYTFLGSNIRRFILSSVTDEIFYYVEQKGMEMEIRIRRASKQAAFMLSALREIRAEGQALEKRRQESKEQDKGTTIGALLGPAIKADAADAVIPEGFEVPANLEFIGLELDLPVGFQRLRWALLSGGSDFVTEALYKAEAKYTEIVLGEWDKHHEYIGSTNLPDTVDPNDFVGATKEGEYMMPRSAFVAANMCYETHNIIAYNDYCFCIKKRARNPDAPFGKTFIAWTQYVVINLGGNSCRLICSVEPEFPNGEPMVARQIRSGMRAGTGELFVLTGETIAKYADEYP